MSRLDPEPVAVIDGYRWQARDEATDLNPVLAYGCTWVITTRTRGEVRSGNSYPNEAAAKAMYRKKEKEGRRPMLTRRAFAGMIRL